MKQAKLRSIGIASAVELYDKIITEHSKVRITIFAFAFAFAFGFGFAHFLVLCTEEEEPHD